MTQNEIIEMAREADGQVTMWVNHSTIQKTTTFTFESPIDYRVSGDYPEMYHIKFLERFAKLVAAKEQKKWQDQTEVEIHEAVFEEREACAKECESSGLRAVMIFGKRKINNHTADVVADVTCAPKYRY